MQWPIKKKMLQEVDLMLKSLNESLFCSFLIFFLGEVQNPSSQGICFFKEILALVIYHFPSIM